MANEREEKNLPRGDSKYAQKFAQRRRADGGSERPRPRPLDHDYTASHVATPWVGPDLSLLPHEKRNIAQIRRLTAKKLTPDGGLNPETGS